MSAVRFFHIAEGAEDPFLPVLHRLRYILQGMKKVEAEKGIDRRERLHMTPHILRRIKVMCEPSASDPDVVMLWAARCLGFFGFLRTGEMTVPSYSAYDPSVHLSYKDIAVDDLANPQTVSVFIKQSKTDLFRRGINLFVGRTSSDLCPVMALLNYLVVRGPREGSLFMFSDGRRCRALGQMLEGNPPSFLPPFTLLGTMHRT